MKPGIPWSVKGIEPEVREAAKHAAKRAGMTLGEWLNTVILDQNDQPDTAPQGADSSSAQEYFSRDPERPAVRHDERQWRSEPPRRAENTIRLEDIAQQLSQLAQRERESAAIMPYEPPRGRSEDREVLDRILGRIDNNERQAVEAFTAVNERLSVLGRQIAMAAKPQVLEKPEDVPGFPALEAAIRNVVEHIEVSEKRTRDSLKAMQDRLGDMAERATQPTNPDDLVRAAPAFASLESRIAEMSARVQRSEHHLQSGLPDIVRLELNQLADRIEAVKASAETLASQAETSAVGVARHELRDIETRILDVLKEAQAMIGGQQAVTTDVQRLRGEISGLNKRIDEVKSATATERDVHALRVAVEQLSTRVAQGPDMRPLADMDRRIGDLTRKLDQNNAAARNLPQFGELERRIAELDHRLGEAMRLQGDHKAVEVLEQHIAAVNERVGRTEEQLGHLETMEQAIHQLYQSLEQNRAQVSQTAEEAANRAVERVLASQAQAGPSPELRAMEEGLRAVRESATNAEQRNQETLEAVHETLEQIVNKLTELETASAGHQLAVNMAQQAAQASAAVHGPDTADFAGMAQEPISAGGRFYDPTGAFDQQIDSPPQAQEQAYEPPQPEHSASPEYSSPAPESRPAQQMPEFGPADGGARQQAADYTASATAAVGSDDFIAAARRAAQAAASRPGNATSELKAGTKPAAAPSAKKGFNLPFFKAKESYKPVTYVNGQPVVDRPDVSANDNKRKKLVLAGIVLLAAVSAFAFNMLAKPKAIKQTTAIEAPVSPVAMSPAAAPQQPKAALPAASAANAQPQKPIDASQADFMATGSLPARKTEATLTSIVAQPGAARAEMPPPEAGPLALREAAARGDAKAQFIIASRYLDGQSVAQDLPKAAYWYQQSAARGLAPAQYRLATLFERGKGVPQDLATALVWYERAAESGNLKAMHNAAVIAAGNQAGTPNYDKAFRWFLAAAEQGLQDSQFNLAVLFERGLGTRIDKQEALFWYSLAAKQGDGDATKRASMLAKVLGGEETAKIADRAAAWTPIPTPDDANVVAVTDPVWNEAPPATAAAPGIMESSDAAMAMTPAAEPEPQATASPIAQAQELLTRLGYNVGTADGKMGGRTANAIRLFQLQSGLKVTGEITPELIDAMREKAG